MVQERTKRWAWLRQALGMAGLALASACAVSEGAFPGSARSMDDLGQAVVDALNRNDVEALASLRLSMEEHNGVVWPELPAAQGENPFPIDLAWQNIELRNQRAVGRLGHDLKPLMPMAFEGVECRGETQVFETFQVHTDCYTRFTQGGSTWEIQLFKDVLERSGGHKIFRYYDEHPRPVGRGG